MRRHSLQLLAVVATLVALSAPAVAAPRTASACAEPNCQIIVPIGGLSVNDYDSPISMTSSGASFAETAPTGEANAIVIPGSLGLLVADWRGTNQGFDVQVYSDGFNSSLADGYTIPATDLTVSAVTSTLTACLGQGTPGCSGMDTAPGAVGSMLDSATNPVIAVACPISATGDGLYNIDLAMDLNLNGTDAEIFGSAPASWFTNFTVTINEGPDLDFGALGCG